MLRHENVCVEHDTVGARGSIQPTQVRNVIGFREKAISVIVAALHNVLRKSGCRDPVQAWHFVDLSTFT
jgi:cysteine sulfinate desulfinase/cysteine desulfurase-like protein